jgi:hypothetical protein
VLAKFPDDTHILDPGTSNARPNLQSLRNDDDFRHDCARYCENIEQGRHDDEWLNQAWVAHEMHRAGEFDGYLREKFEEDWDVKLPEEEIKPDPAEQRTEPPELNVRTASHEDKPFGEEGTGSPDNSQPTSTPKEVSPTAASNLRSLTLKTTPPGSEGGQTAGDSPTGLKRKRAIDETPVNEGRKTSAQKLSSGSKSPFLMDSFEPTDEAAASGPGAQGVRNPDTDMEVDTIVVGSVTVNVAGGAVDPAPIVDTKSAGGS